MSADTELTEVLRKCGCESLQKHFIGTTKAELVSMPMNQVKKKLKAILPPDTEDCDGIIKRLMEELSEDENVQEEGEKDKLLIKIEKVEVVDSQTSAADYDSDNDEIEILQEIPGDVCFAGKRLRSDEPTICMTIGDGKDDNEEVDQNKNALTSTASSESLPSPVPSTSNVDPGQNLGNTQNTELQVDSPSGAGALQKQKRRRYIKLNIVEELKGGKGQLQENVGLSASEQQEKGAKKRKREDDHLNLEELFCKWEYWKSQKKHAGFHFKEICELHIRTECKKPGKSLRELKLSNLKVLVLTQGCGLSNGQELPNIIRGAAGNLEEIRFTFDKADGSLRKFLNCLIQEEETPIQLNNLRCFTIDTGLSNIPRMPLEKLELELLSGVNAPKLEELFLGVSLRADAGDGLEKVLQKFVNLRKFTMQGCFMSTTSTSATLQKKVVINFPQPAMPNLEVLEIGGNYKYAPTYENVRDRPAKKKRKVSLALETPKDNDSNKMNPSTSTVNPSDSCNQVGFAVTLQLPTLPKLNRLTLGCYFEIQHLHFSKMPQLEVFMVASPWHLSFKFPTLAKNKTSLESVKELQFPDSLMDPTFVQKVVSHFPNVTKWHCTMPSVAVVRAFAHSMKNEDRSSDLLNIKIQFDFVSSLDWIILDKPWITGTDESPPPPTEDELNQIKVLKDYKYWEEYVQVNQIELPDYTDPGLGDPAADKYNASLAPDDEKRLNGLEVLTWTNKLKFLRIERLPRTLRLPKGEMHFNDDQCEFTNTLIGYIVGQYPVSVEAWSKLRRLRFQGFDLSKVPHRKVEPDYTEPCFTVDLSSSTGPSKKEEKD